MRIAIVNDMPMAVAAIQRVLDGSRKHQLAWVAYDGAEAVRRCAENLPDLILMDLVMPVLDGVEATRQIMAKTPCAVLVVTANRDTQTAKIFEAMSAGALDVTNTPNLGTDLTRGGATLLTKIDTIGKLIGPQKEMRVPESKGTNSVSISKQRKPLVAIGASAGGPAALAKVLGSLPDNFPAAIVVVQHVDEQFAPGLALWLNGQAALSVRLAREGDQPTPGTVLVAGTGDHLTCLNPTTLGYTPHPQDYAYRPSVDAFFESLACNWRGYVVGVLLTGMGRDGANGLKTLRNKGHFTIAQDRATCAVYGMPKAAAALDAAVEILPLEEIGPKLNEIFHMRNRSD
jgi:chemotaxis response regulator CheB